MTFDKIRRGALAAAAVLALGTSASLPAHADTFNASIWFPESHPLTKFGYVEWAETLSGLTNGKLTPKVFAGTALLDPASHLSGVRDGIAQVAYHAGTFTPAELPVDNVLAQLAFSYSDYFVAAFALTDMNMSDPEALAQWKENGIVYGGGYATVPYVLFCTTPVRSLADMAGKRVRMPGSAHSNWAKSVGAVPVNVASSEMYSGLEKGQLDCASNGVNELRTRSLWEVSKNVTMVELGAFYSGYMYGFNRDFWIGLSSEERRIILDTIAVAMVKTGLGYQALASDVLEEAPEHGVAILQPDADLAGSVAAFADNARADAIALGRDQFKMADAEALIVRFEEKVAKWKALLAGIDVTDEAQLTKLLKTEVYDRIDVDSYGLN